MKRACLAGVGLFVLLSATDFGLTYMLVEGSGGSAYEANPVASEWLEDHGWMGLALFKAASVLIVIAAVALIARRRPHVAVAVLILGCLTTGFVNIRSHNLLDANVSSVTKGAALPEARNMLGEVERYRVYREPFRADSVTERSDEPAPPAYATSGSEGSITLPSVRNMPRE